MRRFLSALFAIALSLPILATPVLADGVCSSVEFCVWSGTNFSGGDFWDPTQDDGDWDWWGIENDDDSVKNFDNVAVVVYEGANFSGNYMYCVSPDEQEGDINTDYDNNGDSNDHLGTTSCGTKRHP